MTVPCSEFRPYIYLGRPEPFPPDFLDLKFISIYRETLEFPFKFFKRNSGINKCPEYHIAADTG